MISHEAQEQFKAHVLSEYKTGEACGLVIANAYHACHNVHPEPKGAFKITAQERQTLENNYGPVQAVLHSHVYEPKHSQQYYKDKYNPAWPSVPDQNGFMNDTADWGIVASDGSGCSDFVWLSQEPQSLEKRQFAWFTSDCYAIVRDWYALNTDIRLPNFVREWEFWKRDVNTIEDGMSTVPFAHKVPTNEAQVGDVAVFCVIGSPVPNHLGVLVADNEMLHTYPNPGYYAHTTEWHKWKHKAKYCVRFK